MMCPNCGATLLGSRCDYCDGTYQLTPTGGAAAVAVPAVPARQGVPREESFCVSGDVRVTSSRLIVGGQTYSMANISSVSWTSETKRVALHIVGGGMLVLLASGALSVGEVGRALVMGALGAAMLVWALKQKTIYHLKVTSAGGEMTVLSSPDASHVQAVLNGVNEAIIHRG